MKVKEYYNELKLLMMRHPGAEDFELVYSSDDEENSYQKVGFLPSLGNFDGEYSGNFIPLDNFDEWGLEDSEANSVCIN